MGCGVSRIDANGMVLPSRFRPLFVNRLEEMTSRKNNRTGLIESTYSKKELLEDNDNDDRTSSQQDTATKSMPPSPENSIRGGKKSEDVEGKEPEKPKDEGFVKESHKDSISSIGTEKNEMDKNAMKEAKAKEEAKIDSDADKEDYDGKNDDDEDDDDYERMINYDDDNAFPGSPSFRVYFKDNGENEPHEAVKNDVFFKETLSSDEAISSSKESSVDNNKMIKTQRKKRSFKVLPKGGQAAVKKFMSVKSCYHSSHASLDQAQLLTGKTTT